MITSTMYVYVYVYVYNEISTHMGFQICELSNNKETNYNKEK